MIGEVGGVADARVEGEDAGRPVADGGQDGGSGVHAAVIGRGVGRPGQDVHVVVDQPPCLHGVGEAGPVGDGAERGDVVQAQAVVQAPAVSRSSCQAAASTGVAVIATRRRARNRCSSSTARNSDRGRPARRCASSHTSRSAIFPALPQRGGDPGRRMVGRHDQPRLLPRFPQEPGDHGDRGGGPDLLARPPGQRPCRRRVRPCRWRGPTRRSSTGAPTRSRPSARP